jgi:hypothetical protein
MPADRETGPLLGADAETLAILIGGEEGRQAEAVDLLLRLATRRFGPLPAGLSERIHALPLERLEALAEAILDLDSLDRLDAWLDRP